MSIKQKIMDFILGKKCPKCDGRLALLQNGKEKCSDTECGFERMR